MAKPIRLDFRKAPASSGGGTDKIPPGRYHLDITKVSDPENKSQNGKPMVVINFKVHEGDMAGKRLVDRFVLPQKADDQMVGASRLHACMQACGIMPPSDRSFTFDMELLVGRQLWAEVADNELPRQENRPARVISQVDTYLLPLQARLPGDDEAFVPEESEDDGEGEDDEGDGLSFDLEPGEEEPVAVPEPTTPAPARRTAAAPAAPAATATAAPPPTRPGRRAAPPPPADSNGSEFPFGQ